MAYPNFFDDNQKLIEAALERLMPSAETMPPTIHQAMRYSVFAGGKRIRPMLCLEASRIFSTETTAAVEAGCSIEFI
ncbi:MAG TPA: polyprenyl synthetase family protein, partial [Candidatus Acidoferrales bacterium]